MDFPRFGHIGPPVLNSGGIIGPALWDIQQPPRTNVGDSRGSGRPVERRLDSGSPRYWCVIRESWIKAAQLGSARDSRGLQYPA